MFQHNIHVLCHGVVLPCVSQGGWEWNLREMENIRGGCETQRAAPTVYTLRKRSLWPNKAAFWWVEMNALPHTSNPKLTEPTSQPSNQVPTLPVVTVLKLSIDFFFSPHSGNSGMIMFTEDCSDRLLSWLPVLESFQSDTRALRLSVSVPLFLLYLNDLAFVNRAPAPKSIILKGIIYEVGRKLWNLWSCLLHVISLEPKWKSHLMANKAIKHWWKLFKATHSISPQQW